MTKIIQTTLSLCLFAIALFTGNLTAQTLDFATIKADAAAFGTVDDTNEAEGYLAITVNDTAQHQAAVDYFAKISSLQSGYGTANSYTINDSKKHVTVELVDFVSPTNQNAGTQTLWIQESNGGMYLLGNDIVTQVTSTVTCNCGGGGNYAGTFDGKLGDEEEMGNGELKASGSETW